MENQMSSLASAILRASVAQDNLNALKRADWKTNPFEYANGIAAECAEVTGHTNWNWYGKDSDRYRQPLSPQQVKDIQIELVDILHFGLSHDIVATKDCKEVIANGMAEYFNIAAIAEADLGTTPSLDWEGQNSLNIQASYLSLRAVSDGIFDVGAFTTMCRLVGLSPAKLLALYFGKQALNEVRWANGYADGSYVKQWITTNGEQGMHGWGREVEDNAIMFEQVIATYQNFETDEHVLQSIAQGEFMEGMKTSLAALYDERKG